MGAMALCVAESNWSVTSRAIKLLQNFKGLGSLAYVLMQTIKGKSRYARLAIALLHFFFPRPIHDGLYDLLTMRPACKRMTDAKETWT